MDSYICSTLAFSLVEGIFHDHSPASVPPNKISSGGRQKNVTA